MLLTPSPKKIIIYTIQINSFLASKYMFWEYFVMAGREVGERGGVEKGRKEVLSILISNKIICDLRVVISSYYS
jgi:hypothetical protein